MRARLFSLAIPCVLLAAIACGVQSSGDAPDAVDGGGADSAAEEPIDAGTADSLAPSGFPCTDSIASLDDDLASELDAHAKGDILRCATVGEIDAATLDALARTAEYVGPPLTTGARIARIVYRTERGTPPPRPGFGAAVILLPSVPRGPQLPVIVVAHGTVGMAPSCPPSRESPTGNNTYLAELGYPLVGNGYAVILPDYAGYAAFGAPGNPMAGYHSSADEARSVLDAARALRLFTPAQLTDDVVLIGHSQGGHAVLSALAFDATYGSGGHLAGVIAFAPSWFSMASFGGMLAVPNDYPTSSDPDTVAASVWYHYSHAELLDGPGAGENLFAASKRAAVSAFVRGRCDEAAVADLGKDTSEIFDPGFALEIGGAAGANLPCATTRCATWKNRYAEDRPHIGGGAAKVPILLVHGDADDWIPPERARCGFDRLIADGAAVTFCIVPGAKHDQAVGVRSDYAAQWIAWRTLGRAEPAACGGGIDALHDGSGAVAACAALPPND